jgi:glycosyltransferase involved in cell wall biosynthesis
VESFGLVLVESLACETAVVASALPGVRTICRDGVTGRLVPPGDVGALAATIRHLFTHPDESAGLAHAGRLMVSRHYTWPRIGDLLEDTYREVLEQGRDAASR